MDLADGRLQLPLQPADLLVFVGHHPQDLLVAGLLRTSLLLQSGAHERRRVRLARLEDGLDLSERRQLCPEVYGLHLQGLVARSQSRVRAHELRHLLPPRAA